jgi:O-methyltransferase
MQPLMDRVRARVPAVRGKALRPVTRYREMQYPTFAADVHDAMAVTDDYFRYTTIGLAAQRVIDEQREGAFAEVGVWRGQTSALLHRLAPQRRLYLFDTFVGFPQRDLPVGVEDRRFRDTSAAAVRARVGASENVILRPGFVPETLAGLEDERFALVLLDLDLYDPTVASLEFFYERLTPGGYLFMHDYNNPESEWACKRAFDGFLDGKPERIVELGDVWGSAMIRRF